MSVRNIVTTGMLLGTLACSNPQQDKSTSATHETYQNQLASNKPKHAALEAFRESQQEFLDGSGKIVKLNDLQKWLGNSNSTVSFMYRACGDNTCPNILAALNQISQKDPAAKHVIISVDPYLDYQGNSLRNYANSGGLSPSNSYILYPLGGKKNIDNSSRLMLGRDLASTIQRSLNLTTVGDEYKNHNARIMFYGKSGEKVGSANVLLEDAAAQYQLSMSTQQQGIGY